MGFEKRANINYPLLLRVMGWLLMIEAIFMLVPLGVGLAYNDSSVMSFIYTIAITCGVGMLLTFCIKPKYKEMGKREAILLTAMVWAVFSLFGMLPFIFANPHLSIPAAYFEAVSGFTTTGASVIRDVEAAPHGILMWRAMIQWVGGMGIILFTLAVIPMLNHQGGIQLFNAEVTGISHDKLRPRISQTAKGLWLVYIVLTIIMVILLWVGPMNLFDSVCQTMAAVSTGGFSTRNASIAAWDSHYVNIVVLIFMFICGINFSLLYKAALRNFRPLLSNDTFKWYFAIVIFMFLMVLIQIISLDTYDSWEDYIVFPLFNVISTITSTGFGAANFEKWGQLSIALFFIMMFFGACAGSTAGGAKIDRLIFLMKHTKNEFYRVLHPNSITTVRINNKIIPHDLVSKVIAFLCLYMMSLAIGSVILTALDIPIFDAFFATLSCLSNIGFGSGFTGVNGSFANVPDIGLWTLSFTMLTGRLELFTFLVIFTKDFWTKN
ncbi:MAG: TrkH family potassium uptake protein [Muribaculaceae bacterium]